MGDEIKSALEKALERAERLGKASPEELERMEYVPRGNALAARFLRQDVTDLKAEIARQEASIQSYVRQGTLETLVRNLTLPRTLPDREGNSKASEGLRALLGERPGAVQVLEQVQHILAYYEGALQQAYPQFKQEFEAHLNSAGEETLARLQAQMGGRIDVERLPQFQDEWRRYRSGLDAQYEKALEEQRQQLLRIG